MAEAPKTNDKPCPNDYLAKPSLNKAEDIKKNYCLPLTDTAGYEYACSLINRTPEMIED